MACLQERRLASADKPPPGPFDVIGRLRVMVRSKPRPTTPAQPCRIAFGARVRFSWTHNLITGTNVLSSRSRLPQRLRNDGCRSDWLAFTVAGPTMTLPEQS